MTGRSIPEWIATHPDQAVPTRVKLRVWERCGGRCALSGKKIMPGDTWQVDHIRALALGGSHRESNLQIVATIPHREKSAVEVGQIAKADRVRAKHLGIYPPAKQRLKGRGFERRWES